MWRPIHQGHRVVAEQYKRRQEDLGKIPPTFNCRIWKAVSRRRRYNPRPRRVWNCIQFQRSHNGQILHYGINCSLHRVRNSSRGKCAGVRGPPKSISNKKPPTNPSDSILCTCERILHTTPSRSWDSTHHHFPVPVPEPMYRKSNVSATGIIPKEDSPKRIPTGRLTTFQV